MNCNLDDRLVTLSYIFSNKPNYEGGTELSVTLSEIINAMSVQDVGDFIISTYMKISSTYYLVDQVTASNQVTTVGGSVTKLSEISASSFASGENGVQYTFDMEFEHTIPVGGLIRVVLPGTMTVDNAYDLQSNCYRLDYSSRPVSLLCDADLGYFDVIVTNRDFGNSGEGLLGGEQFKLQV